MYVFGSGQEVLGVRVVGVEWVRGLGLGFTNPGGTWGKWDMCVFWLRWCWGWVGDFGQGVWGVLSLCLL